MKDMVAVLTVAALLLTIPFIGCVGIVLEYMGPPPAAEATSFASPSSTAPACPACAPCLSEEEVFAQTMAAYGEGVQHGLRDSFTAHVQTLCFDKPGCFEAFAALRAAYDGDSPTKGEL